MKMVKFIFAVALCAITFSVSAQQSYSPFVDDAVRFSQSTTSGTARFIGLGGANTSLGGDISSISGNPAGLGFYNKSAWSISPVLRFGEFNSSYEGVQNSDFGANLQVPNGGMVFHKRFEEYSGSKWISGTFGIAYNQKTSFYNTIDYNGTVTGEGNNIPYDFVEFAVAPFIDANGNFEEFANVQDISDFASMDPYSFLAWETFVLREYPLANDALIADRYDYFDNNGQDDYYTTSAQQSERVLRTGGVTTLDISYGANYNDKLYLGAGLNINFLNYTETRTFRETPNNDILNFLELSDTKEISGAGVGLTVGAIYKPIQMVNLGVSYTSPTFISMDEVQEIQLDAIYFTEEDASAEIINEVPNYSFIIPQKVSGGATVFLNKYGFVTADVEWVDYASASFNSNDGAFGGDEPDLSADLTSALNYRIGVEGRLDIFRVRAGYALFGNPYSEGTFEQNRNTVSGGVGIFKNGFSADLTYSLNSFNNPAITPYAGAASVTSDSKISSFRLTLGKTF